MRSRTALNRVLALLVSACLVGLNPAPTFSATGAPTPDQEATLAAFFETVGALRRSLDQTQIDLQALLDALDYDAEQIIEFARTQIHYEPYGGALRGPVGVLQSRAGNAIDQALFTANLLKDAGFDARIVRGELTDTDARRLIETYFDARTSPGPAADVDRFLQTLEQAGWLQMMSDELVEVLTALLVGDLSVKDAPLAKQARTQLAAISDSLQLGTVEGTADVAGLAREARDYYWVEWRDGPGDAWAPAHPAYAGEATPDVAVVQTFADSIPGELTHTVSVSVVLECLVGGVLVEKPLARTNPIPASNLTGRSFWFYNVPDALLGKATLAGVDLDGAFASSEFFAPMLSFSTSAAPLFDGYCNVVDPLAASSPGVGLFKTLQSKFRDALGGIDEDVQLPTLVAQKLVVRHDAPGREGRTFTKYTMDRIPGANVPGRAYLTEALDLHPDDLKPLLQRHSIMTAGSDVSVAFVLDGVLKDLENNRTLFESILAAGPPDETIAKMGTGDAMDRWAGHRALFSLFQLSRGLSDSAQYTYRPEPMVVVHSEGLSREGTSVAAVDVLSNPNVALMKRAGQVQIDRASVAMAGIWETATEGAFITPGAVSRSAFTSLVANADRPLRRVTRSEDVEALGGPASASAAMQQQLAEGFVLLVPEPPTPGAIDAWWRVDPASGETLGMLADGTGGDAAEYGILLLLISIASFWYGIYGCFEVYRTQRASGARAFYLVCCGAYNYLMYAFGVAWGKLVGYLGASSSIDSVFIDLMGAASDPCQLVLPPPEQPPDPSSPPCNPDIEACPV